MDSEKLIELIKEFVQKGQITEAERKILLIKAKSLGLTAETVDILIRQELESFSKNDNESYDYNKTGKEDNMINPAAFPSGNKAFTYGFIGFLIGIPLSYFFQAEKLRAMLSLPQYLAKLPEMLSGQNSKEFVSPVVLTCIITTTLFAFIGNSMNNK